MRIVTIVVAALLGAAPSAALADEREGLQSKGEQLAKDGRFGDAIDAFKQADRIEARASHACLIALAYTRRESWPQAELFLSICHQRATAADPLPDWVPLADQQIKDRLKAAGVVEVRIAIKQPIENAKVTVSSFAPDEVFGPRTIYLPVGTHVIFAKADGYPDQQQTLILGAADKDTPKLVTIDMEAKPVVLKPPKRGTPLLIAGALTLIAGGGAHVWMAIARKNVDDAPTGPDFDDKVGSFRTARILTIGLYGVGAGLLVTGILLRRSSAEAVETAPAVSAVPLEGGGAMVSVGWQR